MAFAAAPYVGLPFVERVDGVGRECWDIIRDVYRDVVSIEIPSYGEISAKELAAVAGAFDAGMASETWQQVGLGQQHSLDIVVMRARVKGIGQRNRHCGVMVDEARVLHLEANTNSVVVPLVHPSVRFRIVGFFRHKALA